MIRKLLVNWLLNGVREDLETQAREVFKTALLDVFRDLNAEDSKARQAEFSAEHGLLGGEWTIGDLTQAVRMLRKSIANCVDSKANKHVERLGALRQSIPETVAAEVIREPVIDMIIAKINSKQLKGGIPT